MLQLRLILILLPGIVLGQQIEPTIKSRSHYLDFKGDYDFVIEEILNSGKIVRNDTIQQFLNSQINKLDASYEVLPTQSNLVTTFSDKKQRIFVTTGILSQIITENQLLFFLAREIVKIENNLYPNKRTIKSNTTSYVGKIEYASQSSFDLNVIIDQKAMEFLRKKGIDISEIANCIDIERYAHLPFSNRLVSEEYFNSDLFFVPEGTYEMPVFSQRVQDIYLRHNNTEFNERKSKLQKKNSTESNATPLTNLSFNAAQQEARILYCNEALLNGDYFLALYSTYQLQQEIESEKLDWIEACAWYNLGLYKLGKTKGVQRKYFMNISAPYADFFYFLETANKECIVTLCLRALTDLSEAQPKCLNFRNDLLQKALISDQFNADKFQPISHREIKIDTNNEQGQIEKYGQLQTSNSELNFKNRIDKSNFYYFGISDLVKDSTLWKPKQKDEVLSTEKGKKILWFPSISMYKKMDFKAEKSEKKLQELTKSVTGERLNCELIASRMNDQNANTFRSAFSELYNLTNYKTLKLTTNFDALSDITEDSDLILVSLYQSSFNPKMYGWYFTGLFVVPMPFILSDYLLHCFDSSEFICLIDAKSGEILKIDFSYFNAPLKKDIVHNRIYQFIQKYYESNPS